MKKLWLGVLPVLLITILAGCAGKGYKEAKTMGDCQFNFAAVDSIYLAGVDLREFNNLKSFSAFDLAKYPGVAMGFLRRDIPLDLRVLLEISNPSRRDAAVEDVEYKIYVGESEFFNGKLNRQIRVPAGAGRVMLPVQLRTNAFTLLNNDQSRNDLMDLVQSIYGTNSKPSKLTIKLKPTIARGKKTTVYPGYLTIEKELTSDLFNKK